MAGTSYSIRFASGVEKQLAKIPKRTAVRVRDAIRSLAEEPRPQSMKKLKGTQSVYRIRVGDYRVLYEIQDRELVVLVVRVGHRGDVYSG